MIYDDPPYGCTFLSLFLVRQSRLFEECAGRTRGFIHSAKVIIKINAEPIGSQLAIFVPGACFGLPLFNANAREAPAFGWGFCSSAKLRSAIGPKRTGVVHCTCPFWG